MSSQIDPRLQSSYQPNHPPPHLAPRLPRIQPAPEHSFSSSLQHPYYRPAPVSAPTPSAPPIQRYYQNHPPPPSSEAAQENEDSQDLSPTDGPTGDPNDLKRARACESCRGLKVRCDQDPNNPDAPCKRCAKAKRQCIITAPSRKRQKKTDSRVAELERKIDALTATLHAQNRDGSSPDRHSGRHSAQVSSPESTHRTAPRRSQSRSSNHPASSQANGFSQEHRGSVDSTSKASQSSNPLKRSHSTHGQHHTERRSNTPRSSLALALERHDSEEMSVMDNISRQIPEIIDEALATRVFDRYVADMATHLPVVVFPPQTNAEEVRSSRPIVFLAILVAASMGMAPLDLQHSLNRLLMRSLADCVIRKGEKSVDVIQALLICTLWYRPPRRYEFMNFWQLSHIAAVMAIDIGMGKTATASRTLQMQAKREVSRGSKHVVFADTVEARRTWLGCYFLCSNTSMSLRRPNLVRWNNFMDECVEVLESSDEALPSDRLLCQHARLQHINEDIGQQFSMDDPSAAVTILDNRVQYAIKTFENQLRDWKGNAQKKSWNDDLRYNEQVTSLYMHEIAMHMNHNIEDFRAPFTEESIRAPSGQSNVLSLAHSSAYSECLSSLRGVLDTFFHLDYPTIRALPIFYFIRVAYAVVVLTKLYFAITTPGSEVGKIISTDDLQIEYHLETLLNIFNTINAEDSFRPAKRFLLILRKLTDWFQRNRSTKSAPRDVPKQNSRAAAAPAKGAKREKHQSEQKLGSGRKRSSPAQAQVGQTPPYHSTTPLEFLSEVASSSSKAQPIGISPGQGSGSMSQNMPPPQQALADGQRSAAWQSNMTPGHGVQSPNDGGGTGIDPGLGYEQAMDMTLGTTDADLASLFMGDPMFNFGTILEGTNANLFYQSW